MRFLTFLLVALCLLASCKREAAEVVIYTSVDEPLATPILKQFELQSGIHVRCVTDAEASKTAGLAERILAEKDHPQADVYWGNENFHTINLAQQGAFQSYRAAGSDKADLYSTMGLRARVIAISTRPEAAPLVGKIHSLFDLTDPALKGKIGICHPGIGTASGHIAALYVSLGPAKFDELMRGLRANEIKLLGGNSVVADQVAAGTLLAGITDNDDVANARADGQPIEAILPDQADGQAGTLMIPCTIALIANAPHVDAAKKLIDFLSQPSVEQQLIEKHFLAASIHGTNTVRAMDVDYARSAHEMRTAIEAALNILEDRSKN